MKTYEIKNEAGLWPSFSINVNKQGLITWCSDNSLPIGTYWVSQREFYEKSYKGDLKCIITEIKNE